MENTQINELKSLLSDDQVSTDPQQLKTYGLDWTRYYEPNPCAVVFPKSTLEVQKIVKWCRKNSINIVPSGGRTGLSGGAVAKNRELVLSLEKMRAISEFNTVDETVHCQAGVITEELQNYVKEKGYFFPVDFAARGSSQIGGNIATNAGGIKVLRYGLMRNWVAGLTVVTGTGEILKLNNGLVKNATGYDLRQLFIGSEGTLGIITESLIRFTSAPNSLHAMIVGVSRLENVMKVFEIFRSQTQLTAFELFTDKAVKYVKAAYPGLEFPVETECPIYLLIEFEETDTNSVEKAMTAFESALENEILLDGAYAETSEQFNEFWKFREDITESVSSYTPYKNDISVCVSKVPEFMSSIDNTLKNEYPNYEIIWFGHIGDGNLHISILKPKEIEMSEFYKNCQRVDELLFNEIKKHHGSISAEHGVGLSKKPFLQMTRSLEEISIMKSIKSILDPDHILNPGKIFD